MIRTHHLHIPPDLVLLIRSLVTIEGVGRNLDPHFDIASQLSPFIRDLCSATISPGPHPEPDRANHAKTCSASPRCCPICLSQSLDSIKRGELARSFRPSGLRATGPQGDPRQQQPDGRHRHRRFVRRVVPGVARSARSRSHTPALPPGSFSVCGWSGTCRPTDRGDFDKCARSIAVSCSCLNRSRVMSMRRSPNNARPSGIGPTCDS